MSNKFYSDDPRMRELRRSIESGFWLLIVAVYLIVSFIFGIWAFSWIIFIIAAAIQKIVRAIYLYKDPSPPSLNEEEPHES